jgi:S1-C subfamily serine protease
LGLLAAVVAALVLAAGGFAVGWGVARGGFTPLRTIPRIAAPIGQPANAQAAASKVSAAVVDVDTLMDGSPAAGTGMLLTSSGEVLTNNHVVEGATSIKVTIQGHGSHTASVIGVDRTNDVALLKVDGVSGLPTVSMGNSSALSVGQPVVALGNALGQGGAPAVTEGSITGLNRSITAGGASGGPEQLSGLIQTDAEISPGDSGGPLANSSGQVVGMITAGSTGRFRQGPSSAAFAIPTNAAMDIVKQIRAGHGGSGVIIGQPGYLGVRVRPTIDPATASQLGVSSGAQVASVLPGSPAAQAGITPPAVITAINGSAISSAAALGPAVQSHKPGQQVQVTWVDGTGTHNATLTLTTGPAA